MQTNDELWQGALEDFAEEFIQKFYPKIYRQLDRSKPIEFLDKVLAQLHPDSEDGKRIVDKLMKVYLKKEKDPKYIYIHSEVQGYGEKKYSKRNFIYFYRLFDRFDDNIATITILTDTNPTYKPFDYRYENYGTKLIYEFPIYKVLEQDPTKLGASKNLFDVILLTTYWAIRRKRKAITEENMLDLKIELMRQLLERKVSKTKIRRLLVFINGYLRFEKPNNALIFEEKYDELLNYDKKMGIEEIAKKIARREGLQEGRQEGRQEAMSEAKDKIRKDRKTTVLNMRKHGFSAEKIADIIGYPLEEVLGFFKEADEVA